MPKTNTTYTCDKCDAQFPKWQGRCNECGAWGTIVETGQCPVSTAKKITPDTTFDLSKIQDATAICLKTNIEELDRVLGNGIVKGSLILLGGDPGIGKSTLILQVAQTISNTLYVSGEESANQIKLRAQRINSDINAWKNLKFLNQTDIERIIATIYESKPELVIIDSIQTMNFSELSGGLGSVAQITSCTSQLLAVAKELNIPIIIIGHVTKEGAVAGPKVLEHLVDTVLYLENDNKNYYKILRGVKNRFGSTGEIGIFEMTASGLQEINNPTEIFLADNGRQTPGNITSVVIEGTRPFLVEVQALTNKTNFGHPQRKATGFDLNRLQMVLAVISKIAKLNLSNQDVYLNVAGGLKVKDTAIDLAVVLAVVSAYLDISIGQETVAFGEVGLSGEVRPLAQENQRIKEIQRLKFNKIIIPKTKINHPNTISVNNISEAIKIINKK